MRSMRSCSTGVFKRSAQIGRPCLLGYIDKCSAPCVGKISEAEHRAIVDDFCDFMAGGTAGFVRGLEAQMLAASEELEFVDLEEIPGVFREPLPRISLDSLPDGGAWLTPFRPLSALLK